ncbi:hypothetical protein [Ferruginibacter sp.]
MPQSELQSDIEEMVTRLLAMARDMTWNKISDNCKFILSEIKDSTDAFYAQKRKQKKENDLKTPVTLQEQMPALQKLYEDLYDINLHIYRTTKEYTVIDIRYYLKSSLDEAYRQQVLQNKPMLHCKVSTPNWLSDKNEKFDINWERKEWLIKWKMYWMRQRLF